MSRALFIVLLLLGLSGVSRVCAQQPPEVRLGVLAYEDFENQRDYFRSFTSELRDRHQAPLVIRFAFGTYTDIMHWMKNGTIDAAVIGPGMHAAMQEDQAFSTEWAYLANEYHSYKKVGVDCFANTQDAALTMSELRNRVKNHQIEIVVVDPYSASGTMVPLLALLREGIPIHLDNLRFSYSHSNSQRLLLERDKPRLACMWRGSIKNPEINDQFQKVVIPALEQFRIPSGIVVVRIGTRSAQLLSTLLPKLKGNEFKFEKNWQDDLRMISAWRSEVLAKVPLAPTGRVGLSDLVATLLRDIYASPDPIRIALVLAGGGAKCAYQAGAVRALEEELAKARQLFHEKRLDLSLVVGTSGGAINAIATAMGKTSSEEGYKELVTAWLNLDQRQILTPARSVRWNTALWFFALETLLFAALPRFWKVGWLKREGLPWQPSLCFAIIHGFIALIPGSPWSMLGLNSTLHKLWLWIALGSLGAAVCHLILFIGIYFRKFFGFFTMHRWKWCVFLGFFAVGLPALQAWNILFMQESLVTSKGIENVLVKNFGTLVRSALEEKSPGSSQRLSSVSPENYIGVLGEAVVSNKLMKRDLVITTSPLSQPGVKLPGEYYWYLPATTDAPPPRYEERGAALADRPRLLFDILIGSAAIYPVFPVRTVDNFPTAGQKLELVDGSFAHRSPLEAALEWGSTHVIVIEAATEEAVPRGGLLSNVGASLSYLYDQAQLLDVRARGKTKLFTLVPNPPHIGLLDFSDNFIAESIAKGYREARGELEAGIKSAPTFRMEIGDPIFWEPDI